jgi:hypothetical protein
MNITIPKLKNHKPVLVAPAIPFHPVRSPKSWNWQDYLRLLEIRYEKWINTNNVDRVLMADVNYLMQDLYPGPYRVVETTSGFELKFDDPAEQTFWLLRWS